jgi:uridine kinase
LAFGFGCQHDAMASAIPVLCICGPSAAGKTTFAAALVEHFSGLGRSPLSVACDDYYRSDWAPHPLFGYDTVDAIDTAALRSDLEAARSGRAGSLRLYDMRSRTVGRRVIDRSYDLVVLEGSYGPQDLIQGFPLDALIYLEESLPVRLVRRLGRDVRQRHRSPRYVIRQMLREMLPGERRFIRPLREHADLVVRNPQRGISDVTRLIGDS